MNPNPPLEKNETTGFSSGSPTFTDKGGEVGGRVGDQFHDWSSLYCILPSTHGPRTPYKK